MLILSLVLAAEAALGPPTGFIQANMPPPVPILPGESLFFAKPPAGVANFVPLFGWQWDKSSGRLQPSGMGPPLAIEPNVRINSLADLQHAHEANPGIVSFDRSTFTYVDAPNPIWIFIEAPDLAEVHRIDVEHLDRDPTVYSTGDGIVLIDISRGHWLLTATTRGGVEKAISAERWPAPLKVDPQPSGALKCTVYPAGENYLVSRGASYAVLASKPPPFRTKILFDRLAKVPRRHYCVFLPDEERKKVPRCTMPSPGEKEAPASANELEDTTSEQHLEKTAPPQHLEIVWDPIVPMPLSQVQRLEAGVWQVSLELEVPRSGTANGTRELWNVHEPHSMLFDERDPRTAGTSRYFVVGAEQVDVDDSMKHGWEPPRLQIGLKYIDVNAPQPSLADAVKGLRSETAAGETRSAVDVASSVSTDVFQILAEIAYTRAREKGLRLMTRNITDNLCAAGTSDENLLYGGKLGSALFPSVPKSEKNQPLFAETCRVLASVRLEDLSASGAPLLRAVRQDAVQLLLAFLSRQLEEELAPYGNQAVLKGTSQLIASARGMLVDLILGRRVPTTRDAQLLVVKLAKIPWASNAKDAAGTVVHPGPAECAVGLAFGTIAQCYAKGGCEAAEVNERVVGFGDYLHLDDCGAVELPDTLMDRVQQLVLLGLAVTNPPRGQPAKLVQRDAIDLLLSVLDVLLSNIELKVVEVVTHAEFGGTVQGLAKSAGIDALSKVPFVDPAAGGGACAMTADEARELVTRSLGTLVSHEVAAAAPTVATAKELGVLIAAGKVDEAMSLVVPKLQAAPLAVPKLVAKDLLDEVKGKYPACPLVAATDATLTTTIADWNKKIADVWKTSVVGEQELRRAIERIAAVHTNVGILVRRARQISAALADDDGPAVMTGAIGFLDCVAESLVDETFDIRSGCARITTDAQKTELLDGVLVAIRQLHRFAPVVAAVSSYATNTINPATGEPADAEARRKARKQSIEELIDAATSRQQRDREWVLSVGSLAGVTASVGWKMGGTAPIPVRLDLPLSLALEWLPYEHSTRTLPGFIGDHTGFHAGVNFIDLGQYLRVQHDGSLLATAPEKLSQAVSLGFEAGALFGGAADSFFVGASYRYSPAAARGDSGKMYGLQELGLKFATYVPFADLW